MAHTPSLSISKLVNVASFISLVAAALGNTVFGYSGLELVAGGLALHVGSEVIENVLG